ncbi:MAG: hypothetical protein H7327_00975 [Herminiimonas sp.]|nr:hypothetical protein [Herminiimonas sp.]
MQYGGYRFRQPLYENSLIFAAPPTRLQKIVLEKCIDQRRLAVHGCTIAMLLEKPLLLGSQSDIDVSYQW